MQPSPSLDYQAGDQPVPGYTLVRELGRGAMGVVWLARTDSGFEAALKIIDLLRGGGKKEYRGLRTIKHRKIRHGNLLTLLDYWLKDRDGKLIPDSDEIDATDSFFAPTNRGRPPAHPLSATIPHHNSATTAVGPQAAAEVHRAGTLVAPGTYTDDSKPPPPAGLTTGPGLGATVDFGAQPQGPLRRPVQLIVAMELGDSTLDVRQKQCQENRHAGVPVDELLQYMEHAARGLDYLHREGIVHRDVKPQNIMLVGDVAKVCDYGLIVTTDADLKATSNAFTPLYASPEAVADKPVTSQSDQYSLAVTYIELRTGKSPYSSETAATVYAAKETGKYDLSRVKEAKVRATLKRALANSPNDRFGSCSQFVRELENAEHARSGWLLLATAAAVIVLVGIGAVLAVPYLKNPGIPQGGGHQQAQVEEPPPPPPPSIDKIRASRLAGHYDEATDLLAALGNRETSHWAVPIERLHLEFSQRIGREPAPEADQWDAWRQTTDKLWADKYGPGPELVQLSTLRIFTLTQLNPASVALSLPLTDEFATVASGRQHWDEVLSLDDQKRLDSMVQMLNQRFVELREPLTPAWKARFDEVWPQPAGGLLLVERLRECIQEKDDAGLTAAEADLDYLAREFDLDSQPIRAEFDKVRSEVALARQQNLAGWLVARLTADSFLTEPTFRKQTIAELSQQAASGASPLVQLTRLEADMADREAAGQRYSNKTVDDLRDLARSLTGKGDAPAAWLDHVNFLLGRAQLALRGEAYAATAATAPELQVFAAWPATSNGSWQNKQRTQQAADFLLSLAEAGLPAAKESVLRLHDIRENQVPPALKYISKARELVPGAARAEGLYALIAAVAAQSSGNWQDVLTIADQALDAADSASLGNLGDRRGWVEYVAAYAASKHKDAAATTANSKALARFAAVLARSFKDDEAENSDDGSLYQHVVLPALELPVAESALNEADKGHLASIYAAKARLLERDQYLSLIGMVAAGEDEYGRTIQDASRAYSKANELRPAAHVAAGYGRTLLKLPREMFNAHAKENLQVLTSLVQQYDPDRKAQDPTLRLMDGWVSWRTGLNEPTRAAQREKVAEALRHYRFAAAETASRDPYLLHSLLMTYTSNAHVRAAFCTDVAAGDLQPVAADIDSKDPADMTKTEHLLEAVAYARRAAEDQSRRLPEEAFITEGNGLEDLAYYCKQLDHYQQAIDAFQAAAEKTGLRSKVYPYLCAGRARYRWAIEPADSGADQETRQERLRQAHANLQEAIDAARADDTQDKAEAHRWLALVYYVACHSGPTNVAGGDAGPLNKQSLGQLRAAAKAGATKAAAEQEIAKRIELLEQAWRQVGLAAAMPGVQSGDQVIYLVEQLSHGANLAELLGEFRTSANAPLRDEVLNQVRTSGRDFLQRASQEPKLIRKADALAAVLALERINRKIPVQPGGGDAGLLKLKEYDSLFQGDDGRAELVTLLRHQATYGDSDLLLERAAAAAADIPDELARSEALGQCTLTKAERSFDKVLALIDQLQKTPAASRATIARDLDTQSKQAAELYVEAERLLAMASGPDVVANLELLRTQPLSRLPNLKEQLQSELASARLRIFVTSTANLRRYAIAVLEKRMEMLRYSDLLVGAQAAAPFPPAALSTARPLHDFLKAKALIEFTPNERELLTKLEKKL